MLFLKTFGGLSVDVAGTPGTGAGQQRKTLALLALLAAAGRRGVSRDKLAAFLWPESDTEHARSLLKQACYALRRDLHAPELFLGATELRLNPAVIRSDIQAFEHAVGGGDPERAAVVYAGPFLDGFYLGAAGEFERWMEDERSRLARQGLEAVELLANQASSAGDVKAALKWWRRLTELDPLSAQAALGLMRALDNAGERAEAVQQGRRYEAYVRQELGVDPAAGVLAMIQELQHQTGEGVRRAPARAVVVEPPSVEPAHGPLRSGRLGWRAALAAAVIVLVGGMVGVARSRKPAALDPELIAVAPFDVYDPRLELWHEGLVDVLSRNLDGAGPFRTVSPTVVIRRWEGRADRTSAKDLAERTSAGFVVFGQLLRAGPDSVRMIGAVFDARKGRTHIEIDRTDQGAHMDRLADSVSVDVIRALVPTTAPVRLYSVGTPSLSALKAFLQGEHFLRRFVLDSAITSYDRAVAMDPKFALALRRLQLAIGWNDSGGPIDYFAQAAVLNHGLSPRDSLLVLSDSGLGGRGLVADHPSFHSIMRRRFAALEEAMRRYPEDPEVWYQLGEARFHRGFVVGSSWGDARAAFDRAIALDSGFAPAYIHPVEIALSDGDAESARRYVEGYLGISSVIPGGAAMQLLAKLLEPGSRGPEVLSLDTASFNTLHLLGLAVRLWPDVNETQVKVWPRLVATAKARLAAGDSGVYRWPRVLESAFPSVLIHRGHLREARRVAGNRVSASFMELARLGAVPPETVEQALDSWFRQPSPEDESFYSRFAALPCSRTMDAALWWASRRDADNLRRLSKAGSATRPSVDLVPGRPALGFVLAALALVEGDTTRALNSFLALPDSLCRDAWQLREVRFRLLSATGRTPEAAAVFDRANDRWVPLVLERARVAERLGDRPTAIKWYRFVADAWHHADPELQPVVAEARAALARLGENQ